MNLLVFDFVGAILQPVTAFVLVMVSVEFVAWLVARTSGSKASKILLKLRKAGKWNVAIVIVYAAIVAVSIGNLQNVSPISRIPLSSGVALFVVGFVLRYRGVWLRFLWKHARNSRPILGKLTEKSIARHEDKLGAWLELVGVAIASQSLLALVLASSVYLFIALKVIKIRESRLDTEYLTQLNKRSHALVPRGRNLFYIILIPVVVGLLTGIFSRMVVLFQGDINGARSLLSTMTQVEGAVGILAITIVFVLTQLSATSYSLRTAGLVFRSPVFWVPLSVLFSSVTYNLAIISRLALFFPASPAQSTSGFVDFSFVMGASAVIGVAFFIYRAPRLVSPESIIVSALSNFNERWMDILRKDWLRPRFELHLNVEEDPMVTVERVLARSVDVGDSLSFTSGLVLLRDHASRLILPSDLIVLDAYLHHHFRSLIQIAGKRSDSYALTQLTYFVEHIGGPSTEDIRKHDIFSTDDPPGESLLREIARQCGCSSLRS